MKLSTRARYALRAMLEIAKMNEGDRPISLSTIADSTELSQKYLEQLMVSLKNASLLRAISGRRGGYYLARQPENIRLTDIINAVIGPINIVNCASNPQTCRKAQECECQGLYAIINDRITQVFDEFTLADMADEKWMGNVAQRRAENSAAALGGKKQ